MLDRVDVGRVVSWTALPESYKKLLKEAEKALERAHSPYSGFLVGASFLTESGKIVSGANIETSVPRDSICAEKAALSAANFQGHLRELRVLAVIARSRDSPTGEVTPPCGSCCQMLVEVAQVADYDLEVIMSTTLRDKIVIARISELLPFAFGPSGLGMGGGEDPPAGQTSLAKAR